VHTQTSILIRAPKERIFETTSDLAAWPAMLPHYRSVHFLDGTRDSATVTMAGMRGWIPISWKSKFEVDREKTELRFTHLKAFTKGMVVVWKYEEEGDGVRVTILHDLKFRIPPLAPVADLIIGKFFIDYVARRTLGTFKVLLEGPR